MHEKGDRGGVRFFAPLLSSLSEPPGAKPSSTSAVVFHPHNVRVYCGRDGAMLSSEPGITVMDFWMYFGFVYGILFDGRIITRKTRKSHRNTENIDIRLSVCCTSPAPTRNPRKSTECTKRGQG